MSDIGFRLLHGRYVQKHERLPEMMIGAERPYRARRAADHRARLSVPDAVSMRPGTDIQCILEDGWHRPVIFGREEQHRISGLDALTERSPWRGRRVDRPFKVLIVERQRPDLDDLGFGVSDISEFSSIPVNDAFRRLPTNTHTFIGLSKIILHHEVDPARFIHKGTSKNGDFRRIMRI
jgi:hypothetical protein